MILNPIKNSVRFYGSNVGVIGVPFCKGQKKLGVEEAPNILRKYGLLQTLEKDSGGSIKIKDYGNISYNCIPTTPVQNMLNLADFVGCNKVLCEKVQNVFKENDKCLVLGGDHSIGVGSIAGHLSHDPNISLIWIDAHADLNMNKSSPSGNIHGMPVSMLVEELRDKWLSTSTTIESLVKHHISAKKIYYIGLRDVDLYERFLIKNLGIHAYGMNVIDKIGITKVMEQILDSIGPKDNIHISFDIDGLDIKEAPSTGTPVSGGLTLREGLLTLESLSNRITGFDLVEINPSIGNEHDVSRTVQAGIEIIKAAFCEHRII